jgi:protoporphyrinogen IX oxidase
MMAAGDGGKDTAAGVTASNRMAGRRALVAIVVFVVLAVLVFWMSPDNLYLWMKAVHVIAVISWMAGLLYLPRLFINHIEAPAGSQMDLTFRGMERRLMRIIMNPAMTISWALGLWLGWNGGFFSEPWFQLKLLAVVLLSAAHGWFAGSVRKFAEGRNTLSSRQWRMVNEVPTVLMILIVIMVVVKPF